MVGERLARLAEHGREHVDHKLAVRRRGGALSPSFIGRSIVAGIARGSIARGRIARGSIAGVLIDQVLIGRVLALALEFDHDAHVLGGAEWDEFCMAALLPLAAVLVRTRAVGAHVLLALRTVVRRLVVEVLPDRVDAVAAVRLILVRVLILVLYVPVKDFVLLVDEPKRLVPTAPDIEFEI